MYITALASFAMWTPLTSTPTGTLLGIAAAIVVIIAVLILISRAVRSAKSKKAEKDLISNYEVYTVTEGDTLWSIAEKFFGDGNKATLLKQLNDMRLDGVVPGQMLKIRQL